MRRVVGVACPLATAHVFPGSRRLHRRVPSSGEVRACTPPLYLQPQTSEEELQGKEEQHHSHADKSGRMTKRQLERRAKRQQRGHATQPGNPQHLTPTSPMHVKQTGTCFTSSSSAVTPHLKAKHLQRAGSDYDAEEIYTRSAIPTPKPTNRGVACRGWW